MDYLLLLVSIIGFGPAMIVVWFSLRKYDYPYVKGTCFDDRRVFFLLAIGMVVGTILLVMERMVYPLFKVVDADGIYFSPIMFFLVYVLGLGMVHTLIKFVILNFPPIQGRPDSQFYGVSLGAGVSATWIVGFGYISLSIDGGMADLATLAALTVLSMNTALIHSSAGAILGVSTARKEGMMGLMGGFVPFLIFQLSMFPWFYFDMIWYSLIISTPLTILFYREVHLRIIPNSLPEEIQDEIRDNEERAK